jgi:lactam utilization protein B
MTNNPYIGEMRQRLGRKEDDTSRDAEIANMTAMQRLQLLCGWHFGDPAWASSIIEWAKASGFKIEAAE